MRLRRIGTVALASAFAAGGLVAVTDGTGGAAKPVLSGTLTCAVSATISISPSLVTTLPEKKPGKPGKDKAPKFVSSGVTLSSCTGSEPASGLLPPTGGTFTMKSKGTSRLCAGGMYGTTGAPPTKTKVTFGLVQKTKGNAVVGDPIPGVDVSLEQVPGGIVVSNGDVTPIPPTHPIPPPSFLAEHATDRLYTGFTATSGGKAYKGKKLKIVVVTTETLGNLYAQCNAGGITSLHFDPQYSRLTVT